MTREVRSAISLFPLSGRRRWLHFTDPVEAISAWRLEDVEAALHRAGAVAAAGFWVAGFVSYDAGPAFDPAIVSHRDNAVPLVSFAAFNEPTVAEVPSGGDYKLSSWAASQTRSGFTQSVHEIKTPIEVGDTYQVNHTMRLKAAFSGDPLGFFGRLVRAQNANHSMFVDLGDAAICSASPELFFHRTGDQITTRPMKGTRARHCDPAIDSALANELVNSEKDLAENTMIVDMARNDLGRIAKFGSLTVPELHTIETFPTLHQMTSQIEAQSDASLLEVFRALFPAASITGAPKVSTSHLITKFERAPRGIYTGAVGVISPHGESEFNVAIRTAWIDLAAGTAEYGVGCGIVWDSEPTKEWFEAQQKAQLLRRCQPNFRLLETMRWLPEKGVELFAYHRQRLIASAHHFGFDLDFSKIVHQISALRARTDLRLRLLVNYDGAFEIQQKPLQPLELQNNTYQTPPAEVIDEPVRVGIDDRPVSSTDEFLHHKTTDRTRYLAATHRQQRSDVAAEVQVVAFDTILWNERSEITESTRGNLVIELDGKFVTPAISSGLLAGTFRQALLDRQLVAEGTVMPEHLRTAKRVFVVNAVRGWVPVRVDFTDAAFDVAKTQD